MIETTYTYMYTYLYLKVVWFFSEGGVEGISMSGFKWILEMLLKSQKKK